MLSFVSFCESSFVSPPALGSSAPSRGAAAAVSMSGVTRNAGMGKLQAGYLFPEIGRRRNAYLEANPDAKIISLGIGDTTMPVPPHILAGLTEGASGWAPTTATRATGRRTAWRRCARRSRRACTTTRSRPTRSSSPTARSATSGGCR